jgi:hypothetical protein
MQNITLITGNAVQLALQYFGDATGFVQILEQNDLEDFVINSPIITTTAANNLAGDQLLVLPPMMGITIGMLVYCEGYDTYGLVTQVTPVYQTPAGIPFAQGYADIGALYPSATAIAESLPPSGIPVRIMPGLGTQISTNVSIAPGLDNPMFETSTVTFAAAGPVILTIPNTPTGRGTP